MAKRAESITTSSPPAPASSSRPPLKLYKIGEVIEYSGLSRQTIHNYTMLGLITEDARTPSGHRLYGERVFEQLEKIKSLRGRHSLKQVRELLREGQR